MIRITHFVNPHVFFYKSLSDEGGERRLYEMETKMNGSVAKKRNSSDEQDEILVGDVVAAFLSFWNKWIRGEVKEISENGLFYVWSVDYGVPLVLNSSEIIRLPTIYAKMNSKMQRIHVGGLIDCIPAESTYDLAKDENVLIEQTNWSNKAMEIMQNAINSAHCLKFDRVKEINLMNRTHHFGHLKCQRSDGTWIDLNKSMSNALVAMSSTTNWSTYINRLDSVRQPEWKTVAGTPLHVDFVISPFVLRKCQLVSETSPAGNDESNIKTNNNANNSSSTQPVEATKDNSCANAIQLYQGQTLHGRLRSRPRERLTPNHQIRNNRKWSNRNGKTGRINPQYPVEWGINKKLNNPRFREEVEFFESAFRKSTTPTNRDVSEASSTSSDDSKVGPEEKQTTNSVPLAKDQTEAKPSDTDANTTSQNVQTDEVATKDGEEEAVTINTTVIQQQSNDVKDSQ